jgi:hypothetical protein
MRVEEDDLSDHPSKAVEDVQWAASTDLEATSLVTSLI